MGKSTAATILASIDVPVWDADSAVDQIYSRGGGGAKLLSKIVPKAAPDPQGAILREELKSCIDRDPSVLQRIEAVIHPLVKKDRGKFIKKNACFGTSLVVVEVPLLFETGSEKEFDAVAVVSAPAYLQKERVLNRSGMTEERFRLLNGRQMPDSEKKQKADYIIRSDNLSVARQDIRSMLKLIKDQQKNDNSI